MKDKCSSLHNRHGLFQFGVCNMYVVLIPCLLQIAKIIGQCAPNAGKTSMRCHSRLCTRDRHFDLINVHEATELEISKAVMDSSSR